MKISMAEKIGTPLYMAPELFDNEDHYGAAVDVYAFAFLAFEIMTPKEPFENDHKNLFKKMTKGERTKLAKGVSENMKELINKCWRQITEERPFSEYILKSLSNDFSFSDETVDDDEIHEYLEILEDNSINESHIQQDKNCKYR